MARENLVPGEDGPTDILSPFPAWQPAAPEETPADESQAPRAARAMSRALKSSASAASSAQSAATPPPQQQPPRPKRFNLRDGARDAVKTMRERAEAKQMVVAEPLYCFYNTEISLHFLHALSAYFLRVAKDASLERRRQSQPLPAQGQAGAVERQEESLHAGGRERVALLREVGRSYGRVIVYCSNFERTTADARFFESLLYLARVVVAAAVAEPSLAPEIDKEFDRILRGGVFHPTPISPAPRPPTRPRRSSPRHSPRDNQSRSLAAGRHYSPDNGLDSTDGGDTNGRSGSIPGKRRGVLEPGSSLFASPGSARGGDGRGFLGGGGGGGKKRRGRPGGPGDPGRNTGSSRGSADRVSSTTPPTRPRSRQFAGGGFVSGATSTPPRTSSRRGRGGSPTSRDDGGGTRDAYVAGRGGGRKQRLREGSPRGETASGDEEHNGAAAPFPAFDELSRWKVTRSSVPRMVRLAGEAQRVALSNLALAEEYRHALATELQKTMSSAPPPTPTPTTTNTNTNIATASIVNKTVTPSRPDATSLSPPAAPPGKRAPFWKRRGRALTPRKKRGGGGGGRPAAADRSSSCSGEKEFFCAEALSVCIGSIVGS